MPKFIVGILILLNSVISSHISYASDNPVSITINGNFHVQLGSQEYYTITLPPGYELHDYFSWSVDNGYIVEQNVDAANGQLYCIIQWGNTLGGATLKIYDYLFGNGDEKQVLIGSHLSAGGISTSWPYFSNSSNIPAIVETSPAAYGFCENNYEYYWEKSADNINWTPIGIGQYYPLSAPPLTARTFIRRYVICSGERLNSNTLEFTYRSPNWENRNYIRTNEIWYPGKLTFEEADQLPIGQKQQSTVFYDGLGRPEQSIVMQGSPSKKDLVTPIEYDPLGRETKKHLAYQAGSDNGQFKANATNDQIAFMGDPVTGKYIGESHFYAETQLENSPLNRALKTLAPGQNWGASGVGIGTAYDLNTPDDAVRIWRIDPFAIGAIPVSNINDIYPANKLYKTTTTDERNNKIIDYKDADGRTILKKQQEKAVGPDLTEAHKGWLCTYYVYDDMGRLRFTITPKAVAQMDLAGNWVISQQVADGLCYSYAYDNKGRVIEKKIPDAKPVRMVYDARDRLVLSQNGNQAAGTTNPSLYKEWSFFVYDALDRQVANGVLWETNNHTRSSMQTAVDNLSITGNATITIQTNTSENITVNRPLPVFPGISSLISYQQLRVNLATYYDGQNAAQFTTVALGYADNFENIDAPTPSNRTRGLQTGTKARVLDGSGTFLIASTIYDEKGRILQTNSKNIRGWDLQLTNQYDYTGKVRSSKYTDFHQDTYSGGTPFTVDYLISIVSKSEYDHVGRLKKLYKNYRRKSGHPLVDPERDFTTGDKLVTEYEYDELGQLLTKTLAPGYNGPNGPWMEKLNYSYNIRGWMTGINRDYVSSSSQNGSFFGMELGYDKPGNADFNNLVLNGNVAGIAWKTAGDNTPRKYDYTYDIANRLSSANFNQRNDFGSPANWSKTTHDFSVPAIQYDPNGNISRMEQKGVTFSGIVPMDKMTYSIGNASNKLDWVAEDVNSDYKLGDFTDKNPGIGNIDYTYDDNGNAIQDKNRGISNIKYNNLNLPEQIDFTGKGSIKYIYDAAGNKLQKEVFDNITAPGSTTKIITYSGPVVYDNLGISIGFEEGRARIPSVLESLQFVFDYFVKDHLGNVRMVLTDETPTTAYPVASMETASTTVEDRYYNITDRSDKPIELQGNSSYDARYGQKMSKLTSLSGGKKVGPSILLKVMAGDLLQAKTDYYYKDNGTQVNVTSLLNDLATNLLAHLALGQAGAAAKSQATVIGDNALIDGVVNGLKTQQDNDYVSTRPKAFLNYIVFDEQMKAVSKGTRQVQVNGPLQAPIVLTDIEIEKNGWIYVFVNNESEQPVYFDNFQITHTRGNILEETHYYPFGLTMKAISPRSLGTTPVNNLKYNGKELQSEEFSDGTGLEEYDYSARMYDPQIGRWHAVDPMAEEFYNISPYSYCANNPNTYKDKDGKFLQFILQYGINVGINIATQMVTALLFDPEVHDLGDAWDKVSIWDAMWEGGVDMIGSKKLQMAVNGVMQMFTYIDQVGLENATVKGLFGSGMIGILEPIIGDAIQKKGMAVVEKGLQKLQQKFGLSQSVINKLLGRPDAIPMCFAPGTKILTEDGLQNIEDIKIGIKVWAFNDSTGNTELKTVYSVSKKTSSHLQAIIVDKEIIYTTKDHPFFIQSKWIEAGEIKKGDSLTLFKTGHIVVDSVYLIDTTIDVYNFSVEGFHTYFVSNHNILVHNSIPCNIVDKIKAITGKSKILGCVECANEIVTMLKKEGISGELIKLKAKGNRPFMVSDTHGPNPISTNGDHFGVLVGGKVYDNIHKEGINFTDWLKDFHTVYGFDVFKTPF